MMRMLHCAGLVVIMLLAVGCAGGKKFDIAVKLDEQLKQDGQWPTMDVDLLAVSEGEQGILERKSIDDYFAAGDKDRTSYKPQAKTLSFTVTGPQQLTVARADPVWNTAWKGKDWLVVFAHIPRLTDQSPEGMNRRLVLPLNPKRWKGARIDITVTPSGLRAAGLKPPK